ncbi:MAG: pyridoxal phosphate-dependent aminotransferase [Bacillota bacterium]
MLKIEIQFEANIERIEMPENLAIGLMVAKQHEKCSTVGCDFDYFGFAFGQSPFSPPDVLVTALEKAAGKSGYADSEGIYDLREAVAGFNARHFGLDNNPEKIIVGPGTKGIFFLLFSIISGDVIIPVPSWIGYAPQARFLGKKYYPMVTRPENNYKLTAEELDSFLSKMNGDQKLLVLNSPNNPTGQVYSKKELEDIAAVCRKYGTIVFSDEIYALTTFDFSSFNSIGAIYPEGTFVFNGLSKDRSAGGYRLGTCHLPDADCRKIEEGLKKLAATMYTNITTPVQVAAVEAYKENSDIEEYFNVTREIHRIMGRTIHERFASIDGLKVTRPDGGFYFYVDFNDLAGELNQAGVNNSNSLSKALLSHPHHIATVTGDALLLPPDIFGARIAYVDYKGSEVYDAFLASRPGDDLAEKNFVKKNAPMMIEGAEAVKEFVHSLKNGKFTYSLE